MFALCCPAYRKDAAESDGFAAAAVGEEGPTDREGNTMTIRARHAHSLSAMALLALSAALGLSACGGGGESTRPPQTSVPTPRGGEAASINWRHEAVRVQGGNDRVRERFGKGVPPREGVNRKSRTSDMRGRGSPARRRQPWLVSPEDRRACWHAGRRKH